MSSTVIKEFTPATIRRKKFGENEYTHPNKNCKVRFYSGKCGKPYVTIHDKFINWVTATINSHVLVEKKSSKAVLVQLLNKATGFDNLMRVYLFKFESESESDAFFKCITDLKKGMKCLVCLVFMDRVCFWLIFWLNLFYFILWKVHKYRRRR